MKKISILGSTGSIGTQVLDVVRNLRQYEVFCITANSNVVLFEAQIREFQPKIAVMYDEKSALFIRKRVRDTSTKIYSGKYGLLKAVSEKSLDLVVVCVVGFVGLLPTLEAIKNKINIAIATKEILVSAGNIIMEKAKEYNVNIIPIDSEHSAIMQCIEGNSSSNISKIILTASGGPFRGINKQQLEDVTVEQALKHPTWKMGKKISVDSATLMNKALEVIEASVLFDITPDKIDVLIHPQSIIHSMVQYSDGSIIAQMSKTDMRIPIQYALTYPNRVYSPIQNIDLANLNFSFEKLNNNAFKSIKLAYTALDIGGSMPSVLNASNETAVELFLNGKISFLDITDLVEHSMKNHKVLKNPNVDEIIDIDSQTRKYVNKLIMSSPQPSPTSREGDWLM